MNFPVGAAKGATHTLGPRSFEFDGTRWRAARHPHTYITTDAGVLVGQDSLAAVIAGTVPKQFTITGQIDAPAEGFTHLREGTVSDPFVYRGPAVISGVGGGGMFTLAARWAHIRDLTFRNPNPDARTGDSSVERRGTGVTLSRNFTSARHLIVLDTGNGCATSTHVVDGEIYGCVILDNGWYHTDRGHGHGFYCQHLPGGTQTLKHNVVGYCAGSGMKTAGLGGDASDFAIIGNTIVHPAERDDRAALSAFNHYSVNSSSEGMLWDGNWSIVSDGARPYNESRQGYWIGWTEKTPIDKDLTITNAWHHGGTAVQINYPWESVTITDSTLHASSFGYFIQEERAGILARNYSGLDFYGGRAKPFKVAGVDRTFDEFVSLTGATGCTYHPGEEPPARSEVLPDDYIANRAIVRIWNPSEAATVTVDTPGMTGAWQLIDALNPEAGPVATGQGPEVTVPMTGLRLRKPAGLERLPHPGPRFGVFLLLPG